LIDTVKNVLVNVHHSHMIQLILVHTVPQITFKAPKHRATAFNFWIAAWNSEEQSDQLFNFIKLA
jgi:hypothetical protein